VANFQLGERVRLRSGKIGVIEKVLVDHPLAMNVRFRVAMEPNHQIIGVNGIDVMEALPGRVPPSFDEYFKRQRQVARQALGPGAHKVDEFKKHMTDGHINIRSRPGISAELVYEEQKPPSNPNASVVFMGLKTVPAEIAGAIQKYGITAQKYLDKAKKVPEEYIGQMSVAEKDCAQAKEVRIQFKQDRELKVGLGVTGIDDFKLLQLANAHKSGPGVYTSGFHSTSGKASYASEYSDASGQVIGKAYYNFGAAIEITDDCYPLVIQEAIEQWNSLWANSRDNQPRIEMSFQKEEKTWKRDYESEILLGGATLPTDFVYLCVWKVVRKSVGIMGNLQSELLKKKVFA